MKKALIAVAIVIVLAAVGGGVYLATKSNNKTNNTNSSATTKSTTTTSSSTTPKLQGNAEVQAVLDKVKANVSTVSATRVYTEATDPNNELGKQGQYQFAGSFYDTAASPPDAVTDNYSTSDGGSIEIYSNNAGATARGNYLAQFQTGAVQA
ncbi:MAG: hypothetical protein ACREF7_04855, partial [Candidatus Saccharimonadales bacterium]